MIVLYSGSGSGDFELIGTAYDDASFRNLKQNAIAVLNARGERRGAELISAYPFTISNAFNHFNDEFCVLHATVCLERYEAARNMAAARSDRTAFAKVAEVMNEIGPYIRFIAVELDMSKPSRPASTGLTEMQIKKLVSRYIGVEGGYLGNFSYRTHADFYVDLDLDIDPNKYSGTTRERFTQILSESAPGVQASILEGIVKRFVPDSSDARRQMAHDIEGWIIWLRTGQAIEHPNPVNASTVVRRALADAEHLIQKTGALSAVDRVHTALHGYQLGLCNEIGVSLPTDANLTQAFKSLRKHHPAFKAAGHRSQDITTMLNGLSSILDAMNPIRNRASVAHPNEELLDELDARFVLNASKTIFLYLDAKVNAWRKSASTQVDTTF